ncbi:flagellar basal-body rod protein FlgF [Rossellomorea vietnamensis]|uniref:flagellar basal-body rod protein FlgF n=1 Tax=Rossellomorea vietnamensis TaxID=218284 RepID=UPI001CCE9BEA|nr:flagellar basal-body rod protein FlgF [Rossellomorea vietnamensis]MCA0148629.1 flagellar basal-body rod protein FlgF [Rossellomorea vietnamensis]
MLRSMYSGISGMKNFQTKLDVIGNNIANVNTYGYKKGRVTFQDLMNQTVSGASRATDNRGGQNAKQVGLGSSLSSIDTIQTQGSLQTTGRSLDVAISGDGYFVVRQGNNEMYTRAGNFYLDSNGNLVTGQGNLVQGYPVDASGVVNKSGTADIKIDTNTTMAPQATTKATYNGNLKSSALNNTQVELETKVKDSLGQDISLKIVMEKTGLNQWKATVSSLTPGVTVNETTTISFDNAGKVQSPASGYVPFAITLNNSTGANPTQDIDLDFSKITQFDSSSSANVDTVNGNSEGYLESFNIGSSGEVNGVFSNGEVRVLSQLSLATFSNPGGLTKAGNNLFQASNNSGLPNQGVAGEGRGALQSGSLEMSNVDLSEEFTEMITAQRGFQANTRIITTSDEILQELVNLKR